MDALTTSAVAREDMQKALSKRCASVIMEEEVAGLYEPRTGF
ncbi:MAG: hypothetical protein VX474_03145 [Pseudomonadota bacterium]|nr:hypothetical protein [Pseudomonadota bacterium]